jgi:TM2 domain-containing membrane protein YozV
MISVIDIDLIGVLKMAFCENCGTQLGENATYCENCGAKVGNADPSIATSTSGDQGSTPVQMDQKTDSVQKKNPLIALILSLIITGVGQIYNGQVIKGVILLVVFFIVFVIFWPLALIVWLFGMYDAYTTAGKINNGDRITDIFSDKPIG